MTDENDDGSVTHSFSFSVGPGELRSVNDDAVEAFDEALEGAGSGGVNHFIDPRRLQTFAAGGPSVWSVATVATDAGTLYLSYGFSGAIDPARGECDFEMSVLVPGPPQTWPALLLRALCRYMLGSGRTLRVGQSMPFPDAISCFFAAPDERAQLPATEMNAAIFVDDPVLPKIWTPKGTVDVRRAVGVYGDERQLMDFWSPAGFASLLAARDPSFVTAIDRARLTHDPTFVAAIEAGSRRDGSEVSYVAVPGVTWDSGDDGLKISFPGGPHAITIHRMVQARLPFGRHLLVHDTDPDKRDAVVLEPGDAIAFRNEGDTLIVTVPPDHALLGTFSQVGDGPAVNWNFT